jgi:type I restriction enzyme S subunit
MEAVAPIFKRLSCILWSEIEKWTPESVLLRFGKLPDGWRLLPVGAFAAQLENREKVKPVSEYRMAGVRWYGEGVFHRETVVGKEQSANYLYPLKPGAIIYNRLFAWKESFAVVPDELDGFYVSNEFPQFEIDQAIALPKYIYLLFNTQKIIGAVNAASIGSAAISRNRFKESDFLGFKVPIPPLPIQQKIVAHWEAAQASVTAAKARVAEIDKELQARFLSDLGLPKPKRSTPPKCFAENWESFERWSVSYNQAAMSMIDLTLGKYPVVELGSILDMVQYGTSEKANTSEKGTPVLRIKNIKDGRIDTSELKHIALGKKALASLRLIDGDILIIRTSGSHDLVGTCAVFHEKGDFVFASYLIRLRPSPEKALSDFITWYVNSPVGRQQVNSLSRQIMQNNINSQELRSILLPLPPIDVQKEIMERIEKGRNAIDQQAETANRLYSQTQIDIEKMILGTSPVEAH